MTALSTSRQRSGAGSGLMSSGSPPPSLERVLREDRLLEYFIRFLKKTRSFENVFFWSVSAMCRLLCVEPSFDRCCRDKMGICRLDVESFRALERREDVLQQASSIYNKYIVDGSQLEVNIDSELKLGIAHEINSMRSRVNTTGSHKFVISSLMFLNRKRSIAPCSTMRKSKSSS